MYISPGKIGALTGSRISATQLRLLVVSSDSSYRAKVASMLSIQPEILLAGESMDAPTAIANLWTAKPDVVLLDSEVVGADTRRLISIIRSRLSLDTPVLVVADSAEEMQTAQMRTYVVGRYLSKTSPVDEILRSVYMAAGSTTASSDVSVAVRSEWPPRHTERRLSAREVEILNWFGAGMTIRDISACLLITENTVKTYVRRLREKLSFNSQNELIAYAGSQCRYPDDHTKPASILERFSKAFYLSPIGLVITDFKDGTCVDASDAFLVTTGLLREELIGHSMDDVGIVAEAGYRRSMVRSLEEYGNQDRQYRMLTKDRGMISVQVNATTITICGRKHVLASIADVTQGQELAGE